MKTPLRVLCWIKVFGLRRELSWWKTQRFKRRWSRNGRVFITHIPLLSTKHKIRVEYVPRICIPHLTTPRICSCAPIHLIQYIVDMDLHFMQQKKKVIHLENIFVIFLTNCSSRPNVIRISRKSQVNLNTLFVYQLNRHTLVYSIVILSIHLSDVKGFKLCFLSVSQVLRF